MTRDYLFGEPRETGSIGRNWDDDEISHLVWRVSEGHSAAEIARLMGRTRNSIISKAYKLGLEWPEVEGRSHPLRKWGDSRRAKTCGSTNNSHTDYSGSGVKCERITA